MPYHSSENYTKRYLYERWVTTKTEVTSLTAIIKDIKRETKEDAAENEVLLCRIESYKTTTDKAEMNIAKLRKDLKTQIEKTTDKNVKYKDMVEQKRAMKESLIDHHTFNVNSKGSSHSMAIGKLQVEIEHTEIAELNLRDSISRLEKM